MVIRHSLDIYTFHTRLKYGAQTWRHNAKASYNMLSTIVIGAAFAALAYVPSIEAHGQLEWVRVGGSQNYRAWNLDDHYTAMYKKQNPQYGQQPPDAWTLKTDATDLGPTDIYSKAIATGGYEDSLNYDSISPPKPIPVNAGDDVTVRWSVHWPWPGHPGPITEHMARCTDDNCSPETFNSLKFFAIAHHNWDVDAQKWPTEMIPESREFTFKLPSDLPSGRYIVRHQFQSLHDCNGKYPGTKSTPQYYPVSFIADYTGPSNGAMPNGDQYYGTFPGMYSTDDFEWHYCMYDWPAKHETYELAGVPVYPGGYTTGVVTGKDLAARNDPNFGKSTAPAPDAGSSSSSLPVNNHIATTSEEAAPATTEAAAAPSSTAVAEPQAPAATPGKDTCRIRTKRGIKRVRRRSIKAGQL